jgi:hypothetical protein
MLSAAIAGVPEAPVPGTLPRAWVGIANDAFGVVATPDDYRTNEISMFVRFGDTAIIGIDHSMLTAVPNGTRSDELTITGGWLPFGAARPWVVLGGGVKLTGDIAGESIQNWWHDVIGVEGFDLVYEKDDPQVVAYTLINQVWRHEELIGFAGTASALISSGGESQAEAAGWGLIRSSWSTAWAGFRGRYRGGHMPTQTAILVADFEEGLWIDYGIGVKWLAFSGAYDPAENVSSGTITVDLVIH